MKFVDQLLPSVSTNLKENQSPELSILKSTPIATDED